MPVVQVVNHDDMLMTYQFCHTYFGTIKKNVTL